MLEFLIFSFFLILFRWVLRHPIPAAFGRQEKRLKKADLLQQNFLRHQPLHLLVDKKQDQTLISRLSRPHFQS